MLELRGVSKHFDGVRAVESVDVRVDDRSIVAIIGPNGAGKSTMFNLITGQLRLTGGEVLLQGQRIDHLRVHDRIRLGIGRSVQITSIWPELTVRQNVQVPLVLADRGLRSMLAPSRHLHRDEVTGLLREVGLADYADQSAAVLSHGDKKRLELAIVLALKPRLLLLDEPTAGMAADDRGVLMKLVTGLVKSRGLTMVFTEHDMDTVFAHAERLIVMDRGCKLTEGNPTEVRNDERVREVYLGRRDPWAMPS